MYQYLHSGKIGDILYGQYFCKEYSNFWGDEKFNFHIITNVPYDPSPIARP